MTCPNCATDLTVDALSVLGGVGVCPGCARSVVLDGEALRLATSADLEHLDDAQIAALRQARPSAWRTAARATKARIKG